MMWFDQNLVMWLRQDRLQTVDSESHRQAKFYINSDEYLILHLQGLNKEDEIFSTYTMLQSKIGKQLNSIEFAIQDWQSQAGY